MSLRIAHLLAYQFESGCLLRLCDTHNARDEALEEAEKEWKAIDGEGKAPCFKLDLLVPIDADEDEVKRCVMSYMRMNSLKRTLLKALASVVAVDVIAEFLDDLVAQNKPEQEPPHTTH